MHDTPTRLWFADYSAEALNTQFDYAHMGTHLGLRFTALGPDYIEGTLPVDARTKQPAGLLHGGASVVLAETLGSVASTLVVDPARYMAVGLEVNANHLRAVRGGIVTGRCTAVHIGGKTHVWDIRIHNEQGQLSCISRLTVAIIPQPSK